MISSKLENYLALLTIRRTAARRKGFILGSIFFLSLMATFALGTLDRISGRSLILVTTMLVLLGFGYLTSWVKLEILGGSIELIDNLLRMEER
jgi:hypothetical protein